MFKALKRRLRGYKQQDAVSDRPSRELQLELQRRATASAADFIEANASSALILNGKHEIRQYAISSIPRDGLVLEFGVFKGVSVNFFADYFTKSDDSRTVYGFDAFLGLQEHWAGTSHHKGKAFDLAGMPPPVRQNVTLVQGWIEDTLPEFLEKQVEPIAFVHIDTDTYTPCKTILTLCKDRLASGAVILFDELLCYPGWREGEFKALNEILEPSDYEWRGFAGYAAMLRMNVANSE